MSFSGNSEWRSLLVHSCFERFAPPQLRSRVQIAVGSGTVRREEPVVSPILLYDVARTEEDGEHLFGFVRRRVQLRLGGQRGKYSQIYYLGGSGKHRVAAGEECHK